MTSSRLHLERIVESVPNAVVLVDQEGRIVLANSGAETLFGYEREALLGRPVEMLIPERYRAVHPSHRQGFFHSPGTRPMGAGRDLFGLRRDGSEVPIEIGLSPLETDAGWRVLASIIDITERKRAGERFRLVVEAAPSAMLMVDEEGVIALVNRQTEQMFGYHRDELLGNSVEMLVPERFRASHPGHRQGFFMAPAARPMGAGRDLFGLHKDGREVPIEIGLNPLETEEGHRVLASIIDITERVETAERLRGSLREKEVLLQEIHHRVKNNLAVIGSLFYLQATTTQDEQTLRILRDCQDRVRSMSLVHERLYRSDDLARLDFAAYTEDLARLLLRSYGANGNAIRLQLDLEPVALKLDRAIPCGLILTELISNALKHAFPADASGLVIVSLRVSDGGGFVLSVADDGVGFPEVSVRDAPTSLGMRLVGLLAKQIDAKVEVLPREPGTEVRVSLETVDVRES